MNAAKFDLYNKKCLGYKTKRQIYLTFVVNIIGCVTVIPTAQIIYFNLLVLFHQYFFKKLFHNKCYERIFVHCFDKKFTSYLWNKLYAQLV